MELIKKSREVLTHPASSLPLQNENYQGFADNNALLCREIFQGQGE